MTGICRLSLFLGWGVVACSGTADDTGSMPGPTTAGTTSTSTAGTTSTPTGGSATTAGSGTGGSGTAGSGMAGATTAGSAGAGTAGSSGAAPVGGSGGSAGGGGDPLDMPPTHTLSIQAAKGEHQHKATGIPGMPNGMPAAVDNRLPKMMGKLIVNVEVDGGGIYNYGLKHGFHVIGPSMFHCNIAQEKGTYASEGRDFNGNCRLETFDGVDHDKPTTTGHAMVDAANSITGKVKLALTQLQTQFPEEDWGYFLAADGSVRWSDVGLTGYSHGASSSVRWAKQVRVWRVVARSGPRDNLCGSAPAGQCSEDVISSWLDEESKTPLDRLYGLAGTTDSEYGDIMYAMERMKFPGAPVDINSAAAPYSNSHRLIAQGDGHLDFNDKKFWPVMDVIWGVPAENIAYANSH